MSTVDQPDLFVVGIAASAGGIPALRDLFFYASCHKSMCFVVVSHLARFTPSELTSILSRASDLETKSIVDGMALEHCNLYVLPPNRYVKMEKGILRLIERPYVPVNNAADFFFESLANEYGKNAIGVVLSGAVVGRDGSAGIAAIKKKGGHTYAQDPATAQFPDMPKSAIETGCVDSVLAPELIGHELSLVNWAL